VGGTSHLVKYVRLVAVLLVISSLRRTTTNSVGCRRFTLTQLDSILQGVCCLRRVPLTVNPVCLKKVVGCRGVPAAGWPCSTITEWQHN
jgi:hypothetical protein